MTDQSLSFPKLQQFLAGYYHQNWIDQVDSDGQQVTADWVLERAITRGLTVYLETLRREVRDLQALHLPETKLKALIIDQFEVSLNLDSRGHTATTWLQHVANRLEAELAKR